MATNFGIHNLNAKDLQNVIDVASVDVTITSPPYFDLKNYDHPEQIGYGQTYDEYLESLEGVFRKVFDVTKETGSLWIIIDMFKKEGEVIPLPFDLASKVKEIGWKLQEVVIWEKDRTVPWAHTGQMRNAFEYILIFSKSSKPNFYIDRAKDMLSLKKWWVRYPERYHPKGKSPAAIWKFDIPTQGSWGSGYIRHFCPLPEELISQIIKITTDEGDIVLDPFAGSGAVLARADNMKRKYIGFELNPSYVQMFESYLGKTGDRKRLEYETFDANKGKQDQFEQTILNLRSLKYARSFFQKIDAEFPGSILKIFVKRLHDKPTLKHKLIRVGYHVLLDQKYEEHVKTRIKELQSTPPLSKFGIDADMVYYTSLPSFQTILRSDEMYLYTSKITHSFKKRFEISDLLTSKKADIIISDLKMEIDETLYD